MQKNYPAFKNYLARFVWFQFFWAILFTAGSSYANSRDTSIIVCFGNSTTAPRKNIEKVYPLRLQEALNTKNLPVKVLNAGIGGSHSGSIEDNHFHKKAHALDRLDTAVLSYHPKWVIIAFGINDAWQDSGMNSSPRIPLKQYLNNLNYIIDQIEQQNGKVILMTPNPIGKKHEQWRYDQLKLYSDATRDLATKKKLHLADVWKLFNEYAQSNHSVVDSLLLDGIHPNEKGHEIMAAALISLFEKKIGFAAIKEQSGKITADSLWIATGTSELKGLRMGPFIRLKSRQLLTVDSTKSYISNDEGKTWNSYPLFKEGQSFFIRTERAIIQTKKGTIILAFINEKERANWNWRTDLYDSPDAILPTYIIRSMDGGKTWQHPQKLHNDWTGAIRDIIETKSGNIVFTSMMMRHNPGHHTVLTYSSNDDGLNWKRSDIIDLGGIGHHAGVTESTLEQLKDGRLWMLMRTNWGKIWQCFSSDEGISWDHIQSTNIDASSAPAMLHRLESGRLVLVWNRSFPEGKNSYPLSGGDNQWSEVPTSNHREELSIMFSEDEGVNWSSPVVIAKTLKKKSQIAYPYLFEEQPGKIWITTMYGGLRISLLEKDFIQHAVNDNFGMRLRKAPAKINAIHAPVIVGASPGNESTLIKLSDGTLKIFYINRPGKADKMMSVTSKDGGLNWSTPVKEYNLPGEAYYANQVMQDKNGTIHSVVHIYGTGDKGYRGKHLNLWYTQKKLNDTEWKAPVKIWDGYVGSIRGFIQLSNNRLIIPMTEADPLRAKKPANDETDYGLFNSMVLYSDDSGKNWKISESHLSVEVDPSQVTRYGAIEPNLIELKNGKLWMLIRTNKGHLYQSFSEDFGKTWSKAAPSKFISSDSPATTVRLTDGRIIILWCANQRYDDQRSYANGGREVLHAAISSDEGISWRGFREVLVSPHTITIKGDRGSAYPSAVETNDHKIVFVSGQGEEKSIVCFDPEWLEEKTAFNDFSEGLLPVTMYGKDSSVAVKKSSGKTYLHIKQTTKKTCSPVWNFPMTPKGTVTIKVKSYPDSKGIQLSLNNHYSASYDSLAAKMAPVHFVVHNELLNQKDSSASIKIHWDNTTQKASLYINEKLIQQQPFLHKMEQGFNYLRIGIPENKIDCRGFDLYTFKLSR